MDTKVNMKNNTKQQIFDAYQEALTLIEEKEALIDKINATSSADSEAVYQDAQELIEFDILNPEYAEKWNHLNQAITEQEQKLKDLYDIQAEANTLAAIVNARTVKEYELQESYKKKEAELQNQYAETKALADKKIKALKVDTDYECNELIKNYQKKIAELDAEFCERKRLLQVQHKREEEEYEYTMAIAQKKDQDEWAAERAEREAEVAEIEADIAKRLTDIEVKEDYIKTLEQQVEEFPQKLSEAVAEAEEKGKKAAGKEYGYEKAMYMKEKEFELKSLQEAKARIESALEKVEAQNIILTQKLDDAYTQMKELASTTVQSNGGIKILDRESNAK